MYSLTLSLKEYSAVSKIICELNTQIVNAGSAISAIYKLAAPNLASDSDFYNACNDNPEKFPLWRDFMSSELVNDTAAVRYAVSALTNPDCVVVADGVVTYFVNLTARQLSLITSLIENQVNNAAAYNDELVQPYLDRVWDEEQCDYSYYHTDKSLALMKQFDINHAYLYDLAEKLLLTGSTY